MCHDKKVAFGLSVRMSHRPVEAETRLRLHAKRRAALVVVQHLLSSLATAFLTRRPHDVSCLLQVNKESREIHQTAAVLGLSTCKANDIMLTEK